MSRRPPPIDRSRVRTTSARKRKSKVAVADEATPHRAGASFADFLGSLPNVLGAADLRAAIRAAAKAHAKGHTPAHAVSARAVARVMAVNGYGGMEIGYRGGRWACGITASP